MSQLLNPIFYPDFSFLKARMPQNTLPDISIPFQHLNITKNTDDSEEFNHVCSKPTDAYFNTFSLFLNGCILPLVAYFGIFINFIGIVHILGETQRKKMFNLLLLPLFTANTIFLVCRFLTCLEGTIGTFLNPHIWAHLIYPSEQVSLLITLIMPTILAHERYCAAKNPVVHRNTTRFSDTRHRRLGHYILPAVTGSILLSLPSFLEVTVRDQTTAGIPMLSPSNVRLNLYYTIFYIVILHNVLLGVLPLFLSSLFSYWTLKCVRNSVITQVAAQHTRRQLRQRGDKLLKNLLKAVVSFVVCYSPIILVNIIEPMLWRANNPKTMTDLIFCIPTWLQMIKIFGQLLMVLGSAFNVIIYLY